MVTEPKVKEDKEKEKIKSRVTEVPAAFLSPSNSTSTSGNPSINSHPNEPNINIIAEDDENYSKRSKRKRDELFPTANLTGSSSFIGISSPILTSKRFRKCKEEIETDRDDW